MAEKTKIYISTRSLNPPTSGGAFQYTIGITNALSLIPGVRIVAGVTGANSAIVGKLLQKTISIFELAGAGKDDIARSEENLVVEEDPAWCIYPYPDRHDRFSSDSNVKYCSIIFDLQHRVFPQFFSVAERWKREESYSSAIRRANVIATISSFSSSEIQRIYGGIVQRPSVVYAGAPIAEKSWCNSVLPEEFLLYPANAWAHKNHVNLFRAFKILSIKYPNIKLVLTGVRKAASKAFIDALNIPGVEHRGYVSDDELSLLRRHAVCLVFPSLYEGFGMPVIEALSVGTPVACSNTTSLPEVGGDAAEYFNPLDPEEIAAAIERAIANRDIPAWQNKAREQATKFSFERTAHLLLQAMKEVDSGAKSNCQQRRSHDSGESVLEIFWKSFPGVDAILLGVGRSISKGVRTKDLKALNALDTTRLDPRNLGALVTKEEKVSSNSNQWSLKEYKRLLKLVSEKKLVVYASSDREGSMARRYSRLEAFRVMLLQLKYLKRTCRECVMGVLMGRWG
jgi:glycosyltransferase involved in cell wall biosynthesis